MSQVHSKFKVFISALFDAQLDPTVAAEVTKFFADNSSRYEAKSIGIEYLEQPDKLVMSVGYVETSEPTKNLVKVDCVSLGRLALDSATIEAAMTAAATKVQNVICHEFYVNDGEFFMVFLSLVG